MKAVITTDIVHSSQMVNEHRLWLNNKIEDLKQVLMELKLIESIDFDTFRGDSFQCILSDLSNAFKASLLIKTEVKSWLLNVPSPINLKNIDVRVSLGIGEIELMTNKIGTSDGEAFKLSGRRLDSMKKEKRSFCVSTNDIFKEELELASYFVDVLMAKTSALQCEVIKYKLAGHNEKWIAEQLGIKQSAVSQRAKYGNWHAYQKMLERFELMYHGR